MKYTEKYIAYLLAYDRSSPWHCRRNLMVPNVSWGLGLRYEVDLVVVSNAGYATEVEIKTSLSDLKNDFKKKHYHDSVVFKQFYYCFPESIYEKALALIPKDTGIIVVRNKDTGWYGKRVCVKRKAINKKGFSKLSTEEIMKLMRLGLLRYWGLQAKNFRRK